MGRGLCTGSALLCLLAACTEASSDKPPAGGAEMRAPEPVLSRRDSGYRGDVRQWSDFLSCWGDKVAARKTPGPSPSLSLLSRYTVLAKDPAPSEAEVREGIRDLEARLGVALPRSYRDFLLAYRPPPYRPHLGSGGVVLRVGVYAPAQVGRLGDLDPQLVAIFSTPLIGRDASDADYYRYGVDQDDAAIRSSHRENAIVVASHGLNSQDLVVLYPQERTADGEMEAAMLLHAGEFRAPSFAELMRQLAHMESTQQRQVPPYAQAQLAADCAGRLAPHAAWWR